MDQTDDLFEQLFPGPPEEPPHCFAVSSYSQLTEDYKEKLQDLIKSLKQGIKDRNNARIKRVKTFEKAVIQAESEAEDISKQLIKAYRSRKKGAFMEIKADATLRPEPIVEELKSQLLELKEQLLTEETQVQEALAQASDIFYTQMKDTISFMCERARDFFLELETVVENNFKQLITDAMTQECEQAQQSLDTGETSDAKALLGNRDECMSSLNVFLEGHPSVLANKEEKMTGQMEGWLKTFFDSHSEGQNKRNRQRVMEIKTLVEHALDELKTLEGRDAEEDMYEDEGR